MPSLAEVRRALWIDQSRTDRLARALYRVKATAYRDALRELAHRYGQTDRQRVLLSPQIREALLREAQEHAQIVVGGHNGDVRQFTDRLSMQGVPSEELEREARQRLRRRLRVRGPLVANMEASLARLDAQVQFFRENGVEPMFRLHGHRAGSCPLCIELIDRGPWPIEKVLRIGIPHMNCRHDWRAVEVKKEDLMGGAREGTISAARTGVAGIVGGDRPLGHQFPSVEAAMAAIERFSRIGEDSELFADRPVDADADGFVYDGTPRERPALPGEESRIGKRLPKVAAPERRREHGPASSGEIGDDPIDVGADVELAAELLGQGHRVRLDQPRTVSTLLDVLAANVAEARERGEDAPDYDLCGVSVPGTNLFCAESKGVRRVEMPQLSGVPRPGSPADELPKDEKGRVNVGPLFRKSLAEEGIRITDERESAEYLRASQSEINGAKVAKIADRIEAGDAREEALFVSEDNYIVDGHHRWAAHVGVDVADGRLGDVDMPVQRVDLPITELLERANAFADEQGIPPADVKESGPESKPGGGGAELVGKRVRLRRGPDEGREGEVTGTEPGAGFEDGVILVDLGEESPWRLFPQDVEELPDVEATAAPVWRPASAEDRERLKVPPAWTDVQVNAAPGSEPRVKGRDAKGRRVATYSAEHHARKAAIKFNRLAALNDQVDEIDARMLMDAKNGDDTALAALLIRRRGLRPGSDRETLAETKAYGATNLLAGHVTVDGREVSLRFTGKKGVEISLLFEDADLARMLAERKERRRSNERLLDTDDRRLREYFAVAAPGWRPKDFRTWFGTAAAMKAVRESLVPEGQTARKRRRREIARHVADLLGNTPTVALQSYIDPSVFEAWDA